MRVGNDVNGLQTERTMNLALANLTPKAGVLNYANVYGTNGPDTLHASPYGIDTHIDAGDGNDTVFGGTGNDTVWGGGGDDRIFAGDGNDTLDGGPGNDLLDGGAGNDTLFGGGSSPGHFDHLIGGLGVDNLNGGPGQDVFSWYDVHETGVGLSSVLGQDKDLVVDFHPAEADAIDLAGADHAANLGHSFEFTGFHDHTTYAAQHTGEVYWDYADDHANFNIWINLQGGPLHVGDGGISVVNEGLGTPQQSWFIL
jgi:Ca2+-binding RTX toxin-like protein